MCIDDWNGSMLNSSVDEVWNSNKIPAIFFLYIYHNSKPESSAFNNNFEKAGKKRIVNRI